MITAPLFDELLRDLQEHWVAQPDKPDENPESTIEALWTFAGPDAPNGSEEKVRDLVAQRISGVPLAYLTGHQTFMGLDLLATPEALIPRKETELLAQLALDAVAAVIADRGAARVIDLCCGSGNVALTLAHYHQQCTVFGGDISQECIALAKRNAERLGYSDRAKFVDSDVFAAFDNSDFLAQVDIVTCNPPYISSAKVEKMAHEISGFEPRLAFDGGPFGIKVLKRLIQEAPKFLRANGWLAFEVGYGQGDSMAKMLASNSAYSDIKVSKDSSGETRAIVARVNKA